MLPQLTRRVLLPLLVLVLATLASSTSTVRCKVTFSSAENLRTRRGVFSTVGHDTNTTEETETLVRLEYAQYRRKLLKSKTKSKTKGKSKSKSVHHSNARGQKNSRHGKSDHGAHRLSQRLSYKRGEFTLSRHPKEKLYPRQGPLFPSRGNLAVMKHVVQSSYKSGYVPLAAVDGDQFGFYEEKHSHASTKLERNPWIHVTLSEKVPLKVSSVQVWFPARKCEQYLRNLSTDEKNQWLAAVKGKTTHKLPWRCQYRKNSLFYQPSKSLPLEISFKVGENVVASKVFDKPLSVAAWEAEKEHEGLVATSVLVRVRGMAQLAVAEIKAYSTKGTVRCGLATCLHGSCTRTGTCKCSKDWIGSDCSVNIRGDVKYLPEELDTSWFDQQATQAFEDKFKELQGKNHCGSSVTPHLLPGPSGLGAGLGSTMYYRTGDLSKAMKENRGYNYLGYFNYARNDFCKAEKKYGEFSCYFEENPNCEEYVTTKRLRIKFPYLGQKNAKGSDCLLDESDCKVQGSAFTTIPSRWSSKDIFWWRSRQIFHLFKVNPKIKKILDLDTLKKEIKFEHPIIGVHIRSGDGCRHGVRSRLFRCRTVSEYLPEINTLSLKYHTKNVFIATDNSEILDEIAKLEPYTDHLNFIIVPSKFREQLKSEVKIEQRMTDDNSGFDSHAALMSAFQDIFLLAECDYLVTHQASTMSRIALNLASLNQKAIPPFISLDGPWCSHWRMCCEPRHDTGEQLTC